MPDSTRTLAPRLVAIDVARALALVGIMINHIMAPHPASLVWWDFHAIGFCLLIGVGAHYSVARAADKKVAVLRALVRAAVLVIAGLTLENLPNGGISVILARLAIVTVFTAFLALLPRRMLGWLSAALLVALPVFGLLIMWNFPRAFIHSAGWLTVHQPGAWLSMLVAPFYPALTWTSVACLGLWVSQKWDLGSGRSMGRLALWGAGMSLVAAVTAVVTWLAVGLPRRWSWISIANGDYTSFADKRWLFQVGAYLPNPPSLVFSSGIVMMGLAGICVLVDRWPTWKAWKPLATLGAMTFSAYFLHVLLEGGAKYLTDQGLWAPWGWWRWAAELLIVSVVLLAWSRLPGRLSKGPLEWLSRVAASTLVPSKKAPSQAQRP